MHSLEAREHVKMLFKKIHKKDRKHSGAIRNKIEQILADQYHFKPLRAPLQNKRRVHVYTPFILIYKIDEARKTAVIDEYEHHDNVYK